jgi:hypothetical protein
MSRARCVRSISVLALLIASTIQGLTPDADSVVSPFALQWLQLYAAGHRDAAHGRRPDVDRSAPSNDAHHDEAPDEVGLPVRPGAETILSRRPTDSHSGLFTSTGLGKPWARLDSLLPGLSPRPSAPITDLVSSLCRMIC